MDKLDCIKLPVERELQTLQTMMDCSLETSIPILKSVLQHITRQKGKMMRPLLILLAAKEFGKISDETYHAGIALEIMHTASLVHDDVVDESGERRGQPSVNALYDNRVAVLAGDYLYTKVLAHSILSHRMKVVDAIAQLGQDLVNGEMLQLSNTGTQELSEGTYFEVIRKKTATLFATCAKLGALTAGASEAEVERFRLFGEKVGMCFQIKDDIFDYFHDETVGKPTGNDMAEGKLTLPVLYALRHTQEEEILALVPKVKNMTATPEEMARLTEFAKANGGIEYAEEVMGHYKEEALLLLSELQNEAVRRSLVAYVEYVIERER